MYNLIDKGTITPETANLKQRIYEEYLADNKKKQFLKYYNNGEIGEFFLMIK